MTVEPLRVLALVQRRDQGVLRPLLQWLASGGVFETRTLTEPGGLAGMPPGLLLVATEPGGGPDPQAAILDFLDRGGRVLALGDSLAAWPEVTSRLGWTPLSQAPASELMVRPRPGHAITARLDPEIPLRDRLRLSAGPPPDAVVLLEVPWHYRTEVAAFESMVGPGRLLNLGLGTEPAALANPLVHRLAHRALLHLAGREPVRPLGAGLIGYGAIGREHALSLEGVDGFRLRAVCDSQRARREQAADEFEVSLHGRVEDILAEPEVDLVVVGTPPSSHLEMVLMALAAGKHVVCEKPFALTSGECDTMIDAAREGRRVLTVYQSRRWDPDYVAMSTALARGAIGAPFYMEAFIGGYSHPCSYWHSHEPISGGTIYDWGSHYFDWVLRIFPEPVVRVAAQQHKRLWHDVTNADQVRVDLTFEGGAQASFLQSDIAAALKPKWYLLGTEGAIVGDWRQETVTSRAWTGDLVEDRLAPAEVPAQVTLHRPAPGGGLNREVLAIPRRSPDAFYRNLADHLQAGEPLEVPAEQARRTVAVMELAARSLAEDGRQIDTCL